jgi:RES domain-containing protein
MRLYRIARRTYLRDLSGTGSRLHGGRWNSPGRAVVYTAGSVSLATLELLCHTPLTLIPEAFGLLTLEVPDAPELLETIDPADLPDEWRAAPAPTALALIGDAWLQRGDSLLLRVPSAVVPSEWNYLLNPAHARMAEVRIAEEAAFALDARLGASWTPRPLF